MAMTKQQMVATSSGVGFALAVGVLGWFLYGAISERGEAETMLEDNQASFQRYNSAAVFPSLKSIADVNTNTASLKAWREGALARVSPGDTAFPEETPPVFKQRLQNEVTALANLPGGVNGKIAAEGFLFGFDKYLGESAVLPERKELPQLAVQLDTISRIVKMMVEAGALDVRKCESLVKAEPQEEEKPRGRKKVAKKKVVNEGPQRTSSAYAFTFTARPEALVKVLNALTADTRFLVVSDFAFHPERDTILDSLSARDEAANKKNERSGRRGRRGRRVSEEKEPEAEENANRLVTDPEIAAPLVVDMKVTVWDFGTGKEAK